MIFLINNNKIDILKIKLEYKSNAREKEKNLEKCQILSYSSVRNDYGVQALAPTITLEFYLMTFDWNEK